MRTLIAAFAALAPITAFAVTPCAEPRFEELRVSLGPAGSGRVAADLNLDGAADLIALDRSTGILWVVWGRRDRDLGAPRPLLEVPAISALYESIDFQGLGRTDLLVRTASGPAALLGAGSGSFRLIPVDFDPTLPRDSWALADVNRDGFLDYLAAVGEQPVMQTYLGDGAGRFRLAATSPVLVKLGFATLALGDVDGDGVLDAILEGGLDYVVQVLTLRGDGRGGFAGSREIARIPQRFASGAPRVADFDGDGALDVLIRVGSASRDLNPVLGSYAIFGDGRGGFNDLQSAGAAGSMIVDVDGDGRDDIVESGFHCFGPCTSFTSLFRALPGRKFVGVALVAGDRSTAYQVGDVDADGRPDILASVGAATTMLVNSCDGSTFTKTFVIPAVLSTSGARGVPISSELVLTNRGRRDVEVQLAYSAATGGGSGSADVSLPAGRQRIVSDVLPELRTLGVPIPEGAGHVGSLRVRFSGLASPLDANASARTISPYGSGQVGVGIDAIPVAEGLVATTSIAILREDEELHTNLALVSMARPEEGEVILRVTLRSGGKSVVLPDERLAPGQFVQLDRVLQRADLTEAWCRVERISGDAPYAAYAVLTDNISGDGSVVPAMTGGTAFDSILSVVAETESFGTEVVVTNTSAQDREIKLRFHSPGSAVSTKTVFVPAGAVVGLRSFAGELCGGPGLCAGPVRNEYFTDISGIGLRQDERHRTNIGLNVSGRYRIEVFDGITGELAVTIEDLWVQSWVQLSSFLLVHAPGVTQGYARVARTDLRVRGVVISLPGAYAVLNDGAAPGLGTGDGTFIPAK